MSVGVATAVCPCSSSVQEGVSSPWHYCHVWSAGHEERGEPLAGSSLPLSSYLLSFSLPLQSLQLLSPSEARDELGLPLHNLTFSATVTMETRPRPSSELIESLVEVMQK